MKKTPKPYRPPVIKTTTGREPVVFLLCSGQYNCVNEVGYDCCQPTATTCYTDC